MAAVLSESVLDQNGPNDHFGQNDLISHRILAFARPKWPEEVHFGPFRSANRILAILDDLCSAGNLEPRFGNHGLQTLGLGWARNTTPTISGYTTVELATGRRPTDHMDLELMKPEQLSTQDLP